MEDFNTVFPLLDLLYGIDLDEEDAIDIGLIAWRKIGNRRFKLYRYHGLVDPETHSVELPCNCNEDDVEAVTYPFEDWLYTDNLTNHENIDSAFVEHHNEHHKMLTNPFYTHGRYVKYEMGPGRLYVDGPVPFIDILYKGTYLDDDGLPRISEKEAEAIACYIAYTEKFKEGWLKGNNQLLLLAQLLEQRWLKLCDAARVRDLNQNDFNKILDARSNWNRKIYGKSYKPIR